MRTRRHRISPEETQIYGRVCSPGHKTLSLSTNNCGLTHRNDERGSVLVELCADKRQTGRHGTSGERWESDKDGEREERKEGEGS